MILVVSSVRDVYVCPRNLSRLRCSFVFDIAALLKFYYNKFMYSFLLFIYVSETLAFVHSLDIRASLLFPSLEIVPRFVCYQVKGMTEALPTSQYDQTPHNCHCFAIAIYFMCKIISIEWKCALSVILPFGKHSEFNVPFAVQRFYQKTFSIQNDWLVINNIICGACITALTCWFKEVWPKSPNI